MIDIGWPRECQLQALQEGWDIWQCDGSAGGPFQIQVLEEPELLPELGYTTKKFDDDTDAWVHVRTRAAEGSELHVRAMLFIEHHNQLEYVRIMRWPQPVLMGVGSMIRPVEIDPLDFLDLFPRGRCDGCGLGLTENTLHDEVECVRGSDEPVYVDGLCVVCQRPAETCPGRVRDCVLVGLVETMRRSDPDG